MFDKKSIQPSVKSYIAFKQVVNFRKISSSNKKKIKS